jgi:hypothetical protein
MAQPDVPDDPEEGEPAERPLAPPPRPRMTAAWHAEVPWYLGLGALVATVMWWQLARGEQPLWAWAAAGAAGGLALAYLREALPYWVIRLLDRDRQG